MMRKNVYIIAGPNGSGKTTFAKRRSKRKRRVRELTISEKAEKALKEAVQKVIEDHKRTGDPLVVWQNGRVAKIPPGRLLRKR